MIKSKRLEKICSLVDQMDCVIDVGADHGYLEEMLLASGKVKKVIATDISKASLQKTIDRMEKLNKIDQIEAIVCDGLEFKGQSKSNFAIIAGIGGIETINIIKRSLEKSEVNEFVLVPVQNAIAVRKFLIDNNFYFLHDETIFEKGKFYSVIKAKRSKVGNWTNKFFGVTDTTNPTEDFERFVERELKNLSFLDNQPCNGKFSEKSEYRKALLKIKGE